MSEALSDDDLFALVMAAPVLLPVANSFLFAAWDEGRDWIIDHGIVASADEAVVSIPGWEGAGIGGAHIVVFACIVVFFLVLGSVMADMRRRRKTDTQGW